MDEAKAKLNLCTIHRRTDEGDKLCCGCVINNGQNLKVATSRKILTSSTEVEIFAKFKAKDKIVKLQFDREESFEDGDEGIAYLSFDDTEVEGNFLDGLRKADREDVSTIACLVPVLENFEKFDGKGEFSFYKVVKDAAKVSLEKEVGSNKRSLDSKREIHNKHLEVLGSPILSEDYEFLGIVDFLEVGESEGESFLRINYHDGIQESFVEDGRPPQRKKYIAQETNRGKNLLSPADTLRELWDNNIDFRDEFSKVLSVKYSEIKYWPHLAEVFGIDKIIYDAFSTSDINSPTETLFAHLEATQPDLNVKELCESLVLADAQEVSSIVQKSVKDGGLLEEDLVSDICDKAPNVLDTITLKLDREDRLWKNLARARKIRTKLWSAFQSDRTDNPTRLLFDVLAAEAPDLNIKNFKDKLLKLDRENLVKILNKYEIADGMRLSELSRHPAAKSEIETILNDRKTDFLWQLAGFYQKEGLMEHIKIETRFRPKEDCHNPTCKMMEYILASLPNQSYTIKDLIKNLKAINRDDCLRIIEPYLKGGMQDIDEITQGMEGLQVTPPSDRAVLSTNEEHGVASTEQSEEKNPFVTCRTAHSYP